MATTIRDYSNEQLAVMSSGTGPLAVKAKQELERRNVKTVDKESEDSVDSSTTESKPKTTRKATRKSQSKKESGEE